MLRGRLCALGKALRERLIENRTLVHASDLRFAGRIGLPTASTCAEQGIVAHQGSGVGQLEPLRSPPIDIAFAPGADI